MDELKLYIGNKNYSSWSFRPWIALTARGIPFKEILIPFDFPAGNPGIKAVSPSGKVPLLKQGELRVWESLAIIEYAAELFPDAGLWPADPAPRALARSVSTEMIAGFRALRNACPMNMRRKRSAIPLQEGVSDDIHRIETIWRERLAESGGPFLFGEFSSADAMYAPVVSRFDTYDLTKDETALGYIAAMKAHPAWRTWEEAALAETWIVPEDEV